MSDVTLTKRQQQIFDLIKQHLSETGYPPTRAEIAKHFGFRSANAAEEHLRALQKKGVIEVIAGASRGIRLTVEEPEGLPIIGRVAAGSPVLAVENIEDHIQVGETLFHPSADFLLRVVGSSMINIGIMDGDLLAVHNCNTANNGDVVVARVDDEVTVKRLKKTRSRYQVMLLAENDDFAPIEVDLRHQDFAIEGLAVGVLRSGI
ncbi:MAG: transcriptional repressor LexA [bacterium]